MSRLSLVLILFVLITNLTGCMTIFGKQGREENVYFDANVDGVEVICSGKRIKTPGFIPLRRSKSHSCTAQLEGYEKKVFQITSGVSGKGFSSSTATNAAAWGWWTLGAGLVVGWAVDGASGSMKNLKATNIYLEMKPEGSTSKAEEVIDKTIDLAKATFQIPTNVVSQTTQAVVDTTVRGSAERLGVTADNTTSKKENPRQH